MTEQDHSFPPSVLLLVGLTVGFGIIGAATGFATVLGLAATANSGTGGLDIGPMALTAASSLVLGALLITGGVLLWRAHRTARPVIWIAISLLAVSALARMALDSVTFVSVVGSVLSLCAITGMAVLLNSEGVRDHVRAGRALRLR